MAELVERHHDLEYSKLLDDAKRAIWSGGIIYTRFLDPAQCQIAKRAANAFGISSEIFGGFEDAERNLCAFCASDDELVWPLQCILLKWNEKYGTVEHRDILGAILGLGIVRAHIGDILVGVGEAYVFITKEIESFILTNLEKAGKCSVKSYVAEKPYQLPGIKGTNIRVTVSQPRLDAVIAAAYKLSRANAQEYVLHDKVRVNHKEEARTDHMLSLGDVVSIRGLGRMKLIEDRGTTKKGRNGLVVFIYESGR